MCFMSLPYNQPDVCSLCVMYASETQVTTRYEVICHLLCGTFSLRAHVVDCFEIYTYFVVNGSVMI